MSNMQLYKDGKPSGTIAVPPKEILEAARLLEKYMRDNNILSIYSLHLAVPENSYV